VPNASSSWRGSAFLLVSLRKRSSARSDVGGAFPNDTPAGQTDDPSPPCPKALWLTRGRAALDLAILTLRIPVWGGAQTARPPARPAPAALRPCRRGSPVQSRDGLRASVLRAPGRCIGEIRSMLRQLQPVRARQLLRLLRQAREGAGPQAPAAREGSGLKAVGRVGSESTT
jgi:hypothetical protein